MNRRELRRQKACETHEWVDDPERYVEYCAAKVCKKCGKKGCSCSVWWDKHGARRKGVTSV